MFSKPNGSFMPWPGLGAMNQLFDACKLEAVALREGGLRGRFGSRAQAEATLCGFVFDFPCHGRFPVPNGHYLLCHIHQAGAGSWCAGMPLRSGTSLIMLRGNACEMMLGPHSQVSVLMAPLYDSVARTLERSPASFGLAARKFVLFESEYLDGTAWRFRCESAFHALVGTREPQSMTLEDDVFAALLDPRLLEDLVALQHGQPPYPQGYQVQYAPFRRAVDFMRTHLHRDIYLDELARAARVSDRGLRYAFADLLGVSPTRYLALLRLHEASRRLSAAGAGRVSVKSVAMSCGWWDLSRFAANYRRAFGEHPSDTLSRACSVAN
ncbi:helix-turn-helix domain-containing protein [Dyella monticola]|nr:helix-turn-helix domain-containing protein [Dyella monticola]